jgi:hypothetical protein
MWIVVSLWGLLILWLCGRRKMVTMVPVFIGSFLLLVFRMRGVRRFLSLMALGVLVGGVGFHLVGRVYHDSAVSRFYMTVFDEWDEQVVGKNIQSVVTTVRQAGVFGYGLGMSQQGVHNINAEKPSLWQESGPSKLVAEIGVPGAILFLLVGYSVFRTAYEVIRLLTNSDILYLYAGLLAMFVANLAASIVSGQIYGDPFVVLFLTFSLGMLLSGSRIALEGDAESADQMSA